MQERHDDFWRRLRRSGGDTAVAAEERRRESYFRRAFLIDPFVDVRLLGSMSQGPSEFDAFSMGLRYLIDGRYFAAFQRFDEVFRSESRRGIDRVPPGILWFHQLAAARSGRYQEALADVQALLRLSLDAERRDSASAAPLQTNEFRYLGAALQQRLGNTAEATRLYREVLEHDISNFVAHVQLARLHDAAGDSAAGIVERRRAAEANPDDHALWLDLATAQLRQRQWEDAEQALVRAAELGPRDARAFYLLGMVRQQLGKAAEARAAYDRFLHLAPARMRPAVDDVRRRLARL